MTKFFARVSTVVKAHSTILIVAITIDRQDVKPSLLRIYQFQGQAIDSEIR